MLYKKGNKNHEEIISSSINNYDDSNPSIVTEVERIEDLDLVTMTTANGNQFSWYADAEDCWSINDLASCIMESNGTEIVYDDEIVDAHYAGGLKQFAQYAREDQS